MKPHCSAKCNQKGAVLALFAIAMVVIIAISGLALDMSHAFVNKTRMQNLLDAAALSCAMTLTLTGETGKALYDAKASFAAGLEVADEIDSVPDIEFSHTLDFDNSPGDPIFCRASISSFSMKAWLMRVINSDYDEVSLRASAVAGPASSNPCDLSPLVVCGNASDDECMTDPDAETCFGYNVWRTNDDPNADPEEECYLKTGTTGSGDTGQETGDLCGPQDGTGTGTGQLSDIGPGNYQLLDFSKIPEQPQCSGGGAAYVRCALGKNITFCPELGSTIPTKPGNTVGPVAQGLNTVFGIYNGPVSRSEYPPDIITAYGSPSDPIFFKEYNQRYLDETYDNAPPPSGDGVHERRVKKVVIGNCAAAGCTGACDMPVLAVGCFLVTRPAEQGGGQRIWGQFLGECGGGEVLSLTPSAFVQQKIILYKDYKSPESPDS